MTTLPAWFWPWAAWLDHGRLGHRPGNAPWKIPLWAWTRYKLHKRKIVNPAKDPQPHPIFGRKGMFVAWSFGDGNLNPSAVADELKLYGYQWVCVQDTPENRANQIEIETAFRSRKIPFGVWARVDGTGVAPSDVAAAVSFWAADFYVANVEGDMDLGWPVSVRLALAPGLPLAVFTTFGGFVHPDGTPSPENAAPWLKTGWEIITEAYMVDSLTETPENMGFRAYQLGWRRWANSIGLYHDFPAETYVPHLRDGVPWNVYLRDEMRVPADYEALKGL